MEQSKLVIVSKAQHNTSYSSLKKIDALLHRLDFLMTSNEIDKNPLLRLASLGRKGSIASLARLHSVFS